MATERVLVRLLLLFGDQIEVVAVAPPGECANLERYPASEIADALGVRVHDLSGARLTAEVGEDSRLSGWRLARPADKHITRNGVGVAAPTLPGAPCVPPWASLLELDICRVLQAARLARTLIGRGGPRAAEGHLCRRAGAGLVTLMAWPNVA
ncbi:MULTISPECIES: hypothetical protein [unclassified Streptomyces]|uniref:hypothetical protein n=1 Tax=unclassified Streptomyces TaxID=2593676 RepID=UPI003D8F584B